jgi:hypothetical protein
MGAVLVLLQVECDVMGGGVGGGGGGGVGCGGGYCGFSGSDDVVE